MFPVIFQLLTPKVVKGIIDYVFEKNDLDYKMEKLIERVESLEKDSHPPKKFDTQIKILQKAVKKLKEKK